MQLDCKFISHSCINFSWTVIFNYCVPPNVTVVLDAVSGIHLPDTRLFYSFIWLSLTPPPPFFWENKVLALQQQKSKSVFTYTWTDRYIVFNKGSCDNFSSFL